MNYEILSYFTLAIIITITTYKYLNQKPKTDILESVRLTIKKHNEQQKEGMSIHARIGINGSRVYLTKEGKRLAKIKAKNLAKRHTIL